MAFNQNRVTCKARAQSHAKFSKAHELQSSSFQKGHVAKLLVSYDPANVDFIQDQRNSRAPL